VARVLEMPRWRRITIIWPASLPYIYWLADQFRDCLLVIVAVEMLTGGIAFLWDEWSRLNLSSVFLAVLVIGLTGLS